MAKQFEITIDGKICLANEGSTLLQTAKENGIFIPSLCHFDGLKPKGSCRICNVRINGRLATACTSPVAHGMVVENDSPELNDIRKSIIELLFVEGNHFCAACEKSGDCELQALAYRFRMLVPRFDFQFPKREIDATHPKIVKDHNRCILCKRCIRGIKNEEGKSIFAFKRRGQHVEIEIDLELSSNMSDDMAQRAMDIGPVGAILRKEIGFNKPIGSRKYDLNPIG